MAVEGIIVERKEGRHDHHHPDFAMPSATAPPARKPHQKTAKSGPRPPRPASVKIPLLEKTLASQIQTGHLSNALRTVDRRSCSLSSTHVSQQSNSLVFHVISHRPLHHYPILHSNEARPSPSSRPASGRPQSHFLLVRLRTISREGLCSLQTWKRRRGETGVARGRGRRRSRIGGSACEHPLLIMCM